MRRCKLISCVYWQGTLKQKDVKHVEIVMWEITSWRIHSFSRGLRFPGILRGVLWSLVTDISGQPWSHLQRSSSPRRNTNEEFFIHFWIFVHSTFLISALNLNTKYRVNGTSAALEIIHTSLIWGFEHYQELNIWPLILYFDVIRDMMGRFAMSVGYYTGVLISP
jgi:hypothetical protein